MSRVFLDDNLFSIIAPSAFPWLSCVLSHRCLWGYVVVGVVLCLRDLALCLGVEGLGWCDGGGGRSKLADLASPWVDGGSCDVLVVVVCFK